MQKGFSPFKILLSLLFSAVLLLNMSCAGKSPKEDRNQKAGDLYFNAGTQDLVEGRTTEALANLIQASKLLPKEASVWNNLGLAYAAKRDFVKARDSFDRALKLDPNFTDARQNIGALNLSENKLVAAEKDFKLVLQDLTYGKGFQANYNLALIYLKQNKLILAEQELRLALKNNGNYCPAWYELGNLFNNRGELGEAEKALKKAVTGTCFNNPKAHYEIANIYVRQRNIPMARKKFLEVIELFPSSEWARKSESTLNMIR